MLCICDDCHRSFRLTAGEETKEGENRSTYVHIRSCDSGGIYDTYVDCPWCGHTHDLFFD